METTMFVTCPDISSSRSQNRSIDVAHRNDSEAIQLQIRWPTYDFSALQILTLGRLTLPDRWNVYLAQKFSFINRTELLFKILTFCFNRLIVMPEVTAAWTASSSEAFVRTRHTFVCGIPSSLLPCFINFLELHPETAGIHFHLSCENEHWFTLSICSNLLRFFYYIRRSAYDEAVLCWIYSGMHASL